MRIPLMVAVVPEPRAAASCGRAIADHDRRHPGLRDRRDRRGAAWRHRRGAEPRHQLPRTRGHCRRRSIRAPAASARALQGHVHARRLCHHGPGRHRAHRRSDITLAAPMKVSGVSETLTVKRSRRSSRRRARRRRARSTRSRSSRRRSSAASSRICSRSRPASASSRGRTATRSRSPASAASSTTSASTAATTTTASSASRPAASARRSTSRSRR